MKSSFLLALDQGTTGTRALLYNAKAKVVASSYQEFPQIFPRPGWVEHDPEKIWASVVSVIQKTLRQAKVDPRRIASIGITNQRETTVLWDKQTGKPVHRAIVWQDRRTSGICENLKDKKLEKIIRQKTGLVLDPYFSGTKIMWLLNHIPGLRKKAKQGKVLFGTIDTWVLWKLTGGAAHATDYSNASRTLLFNIRDLRWDSELLKIFHVPPQILPEVKESGAYYGKTACRELPQGIPIHAMIGDQQSALYGQACYHKGDVKNTYGTGCFIVMNVGPRLPAKIPFGLLATIACDENGKPAYALEGSVFIAGAVIQWIRDGMHLIKNARETEKMAKSVTGTGGVTFIPAFAGLGSPYWNPHVRGTISGLTRGTTSAHIIRAALESIAQQSADVVEQMRKANVLVHELKVDGGATRNHFLMQFQADILRIPLLVSEHSESTAWGAAKLAGKISGVWKELKNIDQKIRYKAVPPQMSSRQVQILRQTWKQEIERLLA